MSFPKIFLVWAAFWLLLSVVGVAAFLLERELSLPEMRGGGFRSFLLVSGLENKRFIFDSLEDLPKAELYSPFPHLQALTQTPLKVLERVMAYQASCSQIDYNRAEEELRSRGLSPSKLLDWHQAICRNQFQDFALWMEREPYLHPSGASFAKLYSTFQNKKNLLPLARKIEKFFHVNERKELSDFDVWFKSLLPHHQIRLLQLSEVQVLDDHLAVWSPQKGPTRELSLYRLNEVEAAMSHLFSLNVTPRLMSEDCEFLQYDLCFSRPTLQPLVKGRWIPWILGGALIWLLGLGAIWMVLRRRDRSRRQADQALLFQMISHEVRTPLTSLQLNLDGLRGRFDQLDSQGQSHLVNILEGFSGLNRMMGRALLELQVENSRQIVEVIGLTRRILETKYEDLIAWELPDSPAHIQFSDFWFEICLSNLIRNALLHGKPPIRVTIRVQGREVLVEVQDSGSATLAELKGFRRLKPKRSKSGLGLGLRIVDRKLSESGAKLLVSAKPTRYSMRFLRRENQ